MNTKSLLLIGAVSALAAEPLFAQGADQCATAQIIVGTGTFAFDNSAATLDGTPDPLCYAFGTGDIDLDVWFDWAAPVGGYYQLDTCSQTTVDTKVGIYDGGCAGAVLACNDDTCGLQSQVVWNATGGSTYFIRLGSFPGAAGGTGTFTLEELTPVLDPASGHHYLQIAQPGITWTDAKAVAESISFQGVQGHLATITDQAENDFVFDLGDLLWHWVGGFQDTTDPGYVEPGGAWEWITGEPWVYTDWWPGEPNNTGAFGAEDYLELLEGGGFSESWNDVHPLEHSRGFVIEWDTGSAAPYCFGDGGGTPCPCGNAGGSGEGCANSTGSGAVASATGTPSVSADDLGFDASNLLPSQPALLFSGDNAVNGGDGVNFGDGLRCAGGNVKRLGVMLPDGAGEASWGPGLGATGGWNAGDTKRFQVWYRNPTGSPCGFNFNLSHGLEVAFVP